MPSAGLVLMEQQEYLEINSECRGSHG